MPEGDYNMLYGQGFAQQGWQCPQCKRIHAPSILGCLVCNAQIEYKASPIPDINFKFPYYYDWISERNETFKFTSETKESHAN